MGVTIENADAVHILRLATPTTAIYVDPPYLMETRRSGNGRFKKGDYRSDMPHAKDHERLAEALHATPATVLLSGYPSDLYEQLYAGWDFVEVAKKSSSSNSRTSVRTGRTERIWSNRDLPRGLFSAEASA